jgi:hypothetical protein
MGKSPELDTWPDDHMLEAAWGIIANAQGGDWGKASPEWREAATRWRDAYHRHLDRLHEAPKPDLQAAQPRVEVIVPGPHTDTFPSPSHEGLGG